MAVTDAKPTPVRLEHPEDDVTHKRDVVGKVSAIVTKGAVNWISEFTLATGAATTTVQDGRVTTDSQISLMPTTAAAAALVGKVWIGLADLTPGTAFSGSQVGKFVVHHPVLLAGVVASFRSSCKG